MRADYALHYRRLYEEHWWWRAREALLLSELRRMRLPRDARILDVGCGDGLFFERLAQFGTVEGVEPDAAIVSVEHRRRGRIHVGPFDASWAADRAYDLVLMLDVLEHVDAAPALDAAGRSLAGSGRLLLTVPAFMALWTSHDDVNEHRTRYTKATLGPLLRARGFRVERWRYFYHWTAAVKLLVRAKECVMRGAAAHARVPPAPVNRACLALSRIEERLVGPLHLPFGSSLLAIASRAG